ncbi:DUF3592 domain-containing protein [Nannocystis sp. SCPEA4]|uniref:DUF3592 domain-containing protein n=1 Tax=Nannocystis sp. SCPEA4 TaxID=2996787 RepID=UPI00226D919F|nr:DUF3592 domain-containing protein [Nannocystis sp. SCPEA4]MCY1057654.1 DUF3592 domain-containing protein [Nannocystis sp. SCPEA4]
MAVFAALGVVLLAVGLGIAIVAGRAFTATERVEGQVVGLRQNEEAFAPDIAYTTRDGQARVFHSGVATSPPYPLGARVPIVYDPADPEWAALDTRGDRWLLPTIFGGTGGFFLLLGALGLLQDRRHRALPAE